MTLRAQGQAVDGPDDEVSFSCTRTSSSSLSKIIPTDIRDLGCSGVAWPERIDVLALLAVRATRSYLATGRNERRGASFACAYRC